jgi:hypothetical protein
MPMQAPPFTPSWGFGRARAPCIATPHLELLGYQVPKAPQGSAPWVNDVAATRIVWRGDAAELIRDPQGHLQQIEM